MGIYIYIYICIHNTWTPMIGDAYPIMFFTYAHEHVRNMLGTR